MSRTARRLARRVLTAVVVATAGAVGAVAVATPAQAATTWRDVATGYGHTCGVQADRTMWCWGQNWDGQLGLGYFGDEVDTPTRVGSGSSWDSVTAGTSFTCALTTSGTRYCWGSNSSGQLGLGDSGYWARRDVPTAAPPVTIGGGIIIFETSWTSLSAGATHACGISTGGSAYCWGANGDGQLGLGDQTDRLKPVAVSSGWSDVTAGSRSSCGVKSNGSRYCWGDNHYGQLGLGHTDDRDEPAHRSGEGDWDSVSPGHRHTCGVRTNGRLYCWGDNYRGRLGIGSSTDQLTPARVGGSSNWHSVAAGGYGHTCGLQDNGTRYCWGENFYGQLGIGDNSDRNAPRRWVGEFAWRSVDANGYHSCGIRDSNGGLYCWGWNTYGQLGVGDETNRNRPVRV